MQTLGTCYTYIEELEDLFAKIGLTVHRMKPAEVLDIINRIENVCREGVFTNGNVMLNEMPVILSSAMLIMPFVNSRSSMEQVMYAARTVIADRFFETDPKIIYRCCILLAGNRSVTELLSDRIFLDLIGENLYNNVRWFNGEAFQECMFLSCFASALFETEASVKPDIQSYEREIRKWLDICSRADYKLEKLVQ
ncbi:MAG: hypothetical protein MJ052_01260 [Sphaerochaetaceae bacterium]|nr:hypothetical protein [Sphaerochaetaceae bacterium]